MKRKIYISIITLLIIIMSSINVQASEKNSYNLNGSSYELGNEDLERIKPFLEGKEIIGVGEATHGTKEFFQMKHRLFKFLVEEMGYRAFAMEQGMSEMELINRYIQGEENDPEKLLKSLYTTWQNKEFLEFIIWAREYNLKVKDEDKVRFYGFDAQKESKTIENIERYFKNIDSQSFEEIYKIYNDSLKYDNENERFYVKVQGDLDKNEGNYI